MFIRSISITFIIIVLVVLTVSPRIAGWGSQYKPELLPKSYMTEKKLTVNEKHFLHNSYFKPVFLVMIFFSRNANRKTNFKRIDNVESMLQFGSEVSPARSCHYKEVAGLL